MKMEKSLKECTSFDELNDHFKFKMGCLSQLLALRHCYADEECSVMLEQLTAAVVDLQNLKEQLKESLQKQRLELDRVQDMRDVVSHLQTRLNHCQQNLPARLPGHKPTVSETTQPQNLQSKSSYFSPPLKTKHQDSCVTPAPSAEQLRKQTHTMFVPTVDYLTINEFNAIPGYMKGRSSYEQVNSAIDEINKGVLAKYNILGTSRKSQTEAIKKKIRMYKQMETKETKGAYFISNEDLQSYTQLKLDPVSRRHLTCLRHCARLKELHGKGTTCYVICQ